MAYANWDFYNRTWHGSMTAQEFERWSSRSSLEIDRATQGRAAAAPESMRDALAQCCCELAGQHRTGNTGRNRSRRKRGWVQRDLSRQHREQQPSGRDGRRPAAHLPQIPVPARQSPVYGGAAVNGVKNADCTLFHKAWDEAARRDVWSCTQFPGVSWYSKKGAQPGTAGETASDTLVVRIFTQDAIAVDVGDMITPGLVSAAVTSSADVLKMFPDSFKVLRIRDNRRGSLQMQHWRIEGE